MHLRRVQEVSRPLLHKSGKKRARKAQREATEPEYIAKQSSNSGRPSNGKRGSSSGRGGELLGDMNEQLDCPIARIGLESLIAFDEECGQSRRE